MCRPRWRCWRGSPAHAGMAPPLIMSFTAGLRFPRTRGDGPALALLRWPLTLVPPHTRGWPPKCLPRLATRTRSSKAVPPHTRGWPRAGFAAARLLRGSPAHAGMAPKPRSCSTNRKRFPRTRGDGPKVYISAVGNGSFTIARFPRTRGDGPAGEVRPFQPISVPPHTRGWPLVDRLPGVTWDGSPAHAGMAPAEAGLLRAATRFPRTRGDGPREPA